MALSVWRRSCEKVSGFGSVADTRARSHSCCSDVKQQENASPPWDECPVSSCFLWALKARPGGHVSGTLSTDLEKPQLQGNPSPSTLTDSPRCSLSGEESVFLCPSACRLKAPLCTWNDAGQCPGAHWTEATLHQKRKKEEGSTWALEGSPGREPRSLLWPEGFGDRSGEESWSGCLPHGGSVRPPTQRLRSGSFRAPGGRWACLAAVFSVSQGC